MLYFSYWLLFISILHLCTTISVSDYKSYKGYKLYEVSGEANELKKHLDYVTKNNDVPFREQINTKARIILPPEVARSFEEITHSAQLKYKLIFEDFSEVLRSETVAPPGSRFSWTAYYDVDDIYQYLKNTSKTYPESTEVIVGGESYEGRQILGLRINTANNQKDKKVMFIESGIHAREWITPATTTYFINQLLTSNNPNITALRDLFDWRIFPTVNPDGYHFSFTKDRMWRKTRSKSSAMCYGADPNRNWDHNWGKHSSSSDPCEYQVYCGSKPFSEKETKSLSQYISSIKNLLGYVAFHSDAQMLLLPYSDSKEHLDNYEDLVKIGKLSLKYGLAVNGERYEGPATAAEILYPASGGSMDWVREALKTRLVFTYELRGKVFAWPANRIHEQGDEVTQMMLGLVTGAKQLGYV